MKKLFWLLTAILLVSNYPVNAQQPKKLARIVFISSQPAAESDPMGALRRGLRDLGYVEGKNITIEYRYADNKLDRLPVLVDELVRQKVDVLITTSTGEALAAKNATRTIPIILIGADDPVAAGLVDSLAHPGGNVTGFTTIPSVLAGKRLELLKETVPKLSHVAVLRNPQLGGPSQRFGGSSQWKANQQAALELGLRLHSMIVRDVNDFESAFKEAIKVRSDALTVPGNPFNNFYRKRIAELAIKNRLPAIYTHGIYVASGGLMSYGVNRREVQRRAASYVHKILKGVKPTDLPVQQPTKFELVINLKTAKQIGLTIPPNVLARADRVIK